MKSGHRADARSWMGDQIASKRWHVASIVGHRNLAAEVKNTNINARTRTKIFEERSGEAGEV
jgi:hypothetical protein